MLSRKNCITLLKQLIFHPWNWSILWKAENSLLYLWLQWVLSLCHGIHFQVGYREPRNIWKSEFTNNYYGCTDRSLHFRGKFLVALLLILLMSFPLCTFETFLSCSPRQAYFSVSLSSWECIYYNIGCILLEFWHENLTNSKLNYHKLPNSVEILTPLI